MGTLQFDELLSKFLAFPLCASEVCPFLEIVEKEAGQTQFEE